MDGLEAISLLRSSGYLGPIAALTASTMLRSRKRCLDAGCDDFLSKPFNSTEFFQLLSRHLGNNINSHQDSNKDRNMNNYLSSEQQAELAARFIEKLPNMQAKLMTALDEQDWDSLRSVSHDLKGLGGNFGFPELTEIAGKVSDTLRQFEYTAASDDIQKLLDTISQILQANKKAS